jgi:hypothetical protein
MSLKRASILIVLGLAVTACSLVGRIREDRIPRYEAGSFTSAEKCAECHQGIYDEWSKNSGHAVANTSVGFIALYDAIGNEKLCYGCHGPKELAEGVSCVICHGNVIPDKEIEYTHEVKFKPGRKALKDPKFCSKCHDHKHPLTGEYYRETYAEWKNSPAAREGTTCVDCHMKKQGPDNLSYHGQNAAFRNPDRYKDYLVIQDIEFEFPNISLAVENRVAGHKMPTGGPQRTLALSLVMKDPEGNEVHRIDYLFNQIFSDFFLKKEMMWKEIENTKLQPGETRQLSFTLPPELKGRISRIEATLSFYGILVYHHGDLKEALWATKPIAQQIVDIPG